MLSDIQLRIATDILVSAGEVFLASLVVPFFVGQFGIAPLIVGFILMAGSWIGALSVGNYTKSRCFNLRFFILRAPLRFLQS